VEKRLYPFDQKIAQGEYKRLYYLPALTSKLEFAFAHPQAWRSPGPANPIQSELNVVRNEIGRELAKVGEAHYPGYERLSVGLFDSLEYRRALNFLSVLDRMYRQRVAVATRQREALLDELTNTPEREERFNRARMAFQNEKVRSMTENLLTPTRIVEWRGELIQKIYPVFNIEQPPRHALDFRAEFYSPQKHFAGLYFDTLHFNLAMIWLMAAFLFIALYFSWLEKGVAYLTNLQKYRARKK